MRGRQLTETMKIHLAAHAERIQIGQEVRHYHSYMSYSGRAHSTEREREGEFTHVHKYSHFGNMECETGSLAPVLHVIRPSLKMEGSFCSKAVETSSTTDAYLSFPTSSKGAALPQAPDEGGAKRRPGVWYAEEIKQSLRRCFDVKSVLQSGSSKYQDITLLETDPFGKVLIIDNKMQSAEVDEWVYHEALVHPALLLHPRPNSVFIMGGGEGSTAREVLRHKSVGKVVMCDIDEDVVSFCSMHLSGNRDTFCSSRVELIFKDARVELQDRAEQFDVVIGDVADPVEGGSCFCLYTKDFYANVVKPRLNPGGVFITQGGPAGILSHEEVFSSIYNTLRSVFAYVIPYAAHVPSYADTWGWVMASDRPFPDISPRGLDVQIKQRIKGDLRYLDGETLAAMKILNKTVRKRLEGETHVYTEETA